MALDFMSKSCPISKIVDEHVLGFTPVGDVEECASFIKGHGLEHDLGLGGVGAV